MNKLILTGIALAMFSTSTLAAKVNLIDGDTLKIDGKTIRIVEIDTPETFQSRCENELILGLKAKERLAQLVRGSADVTYEPTGFDRFGRTLAHVFAGDMNVGETLVKEGHALRHEKGGEAKAARLKVWCGPQVELPVYKPVQLSGAGPNSQAGRNHLLSELLCCSGGWRCTDPCPANRAIPASSIAMAMASRASRDPQARPLTRVGDAAARDFA